MKVQFPDKVKPIFTPAPYKVICGGRSKGASWSFARAALILGSHRKLFIVCAREVQRSIKDSLHRVISEQSEQIGLGGFYQTLETEIRGVNGTTFVFTGLNNINSVRSTEGIDILWVMEAAHVSKAKWRVLLPTVRRDPPAGPFKQGSEIWIDLNPELVTDDTYKMFVIDPPEGAIVIVMNYKDNPFFPKTSERQMLDMRAKDYDEYLNVWEGRPRRALSGAIYAKELGKAIEDGRVSPRIKHDAGRGVTVVFDLGDSDACACWVFQQISMDHNAIFYMEDVAKDIGYFIKELQARGYIIKRVLLPHDARQAHQAARGLVHNTIEKQVKALLPTPGIVRIVPNIPEVNQISATRALFPRININEVDCSQGVLSLQHYQYDVDPHTNQRSKTPKHNWASHGAKAFGYYAVELREGNKKEKEQDTGDEGAAIERESSLRSGDSPNGWMNL